MSTPRSRPAHQIRTGRLWLRNWQPGDAPLVRAALDASDAHLRPWVPFMKSEPQDLDGTRKWIAWRREQFAAARHFCYGVFLREGAPLLGEVMLLGRTGPDELDIGYWIDVRHVGQGYGTEAAAAMVWAGFALHHCKQLRMVCDPRNEPSFRIPRKLGFTHAETRRGAYVDDEGKARDSMVWTLAAEAFEGTAAHGAALEAHDAAGERL
jgi:RimJ/RimL family protein N-acetyltransferase